jgi:RNA polymerase sigma factor (sigma-70 family)
VTSSTKARAEPAATGLPPPGFLRALAEREVARLERSELVRRAAAGDVLAYEQLFGWLCPQIVRYAKALGKRLFLEARLLDEVVGRSLSSVHVGLRGLRDPAKLTAWVRRIVWNELLRAREEQRRSAVFADPAEVLQQFERGESYVREIDTESLLELHEVVDAISRLPEGQRSVFVLREMLELDVAETSRLLGVSPGTVKSQRHDALRNLRARLVERGYRVDG